MSHLDALEFLTAMRSLKTAKNLFLLLILLSILTQAAGFVLVRFVGVLDALPEITEARPQASADETEDNTAASSQRQHEARQWQMILLWALPTSRFIALHGSVLLLVTLMCTAAVSLLGGGNGAAGLFGAVFWALLLLGLLIPWQLVLDPSIASGATFSFTELVDRTREVHPGWNPSAPSPQAQILYYARFGGYLLVVLLLWILIQVRYAHGFSAVVAPFVTKQAPPAPSPEQ